MVKIVFVGLFVSCFLVISAQNKAVMEINYETKVISDSLNREKSKSLFISFTM